MSKPLKSFKIVWEVYRAGKRKFEDNWTSGAKAYMRGHYAGKPYFESLRTGDREVAKTAFADRVAEIVHGVKEREEVCEGRCNFAYAVKLYFGSDDPKKVDPTGRIARIFDEIAEKYLDEFSQIDLDKLATKLRPKAGPKTRNREVYTPFVAVYNAAVQDRKAPERKWRRPRGAHDEYPVNPPTDAEIAILIESAVRDHGRGPKKAARNKAALLMFALTGERTTPITQLLGKHLVLEPDSDRGSAYFGKTKNGKPRRVLLAPMLVVALKEHLALTTVGPDERVFGWKSRFALAQMVRRAREHAKLEPYRPHDIGRHSFGRRMTAAGMDRRQLKKAGNWDSDAAVARYEHLADDQIAEAVRDVDTSALAGSKTSDKSCDKSRDAA